MQGMAEGGPRTGLKLRAQAQYTLAICKQVWSIELALQNIMCVPVGEREAAEGDGCEGGEVEQGEGGQGHARQEN